MSELTQVTLNPEANIYFDGKCVSYTLHSPDGARKTVGVIFPAELNFGTQAPERMEVIKGHCQIKLPGADDWKDCKAGDSFEVPGNSNFDIKVLSTLNYLCHYAD